MDKQLLPPKSWTDIGKVMDIIAKAKLNYWSWVWNPRCKYINLRIDMRDGHCVIFDRDGNRITLDELAHQNCPQALRRDGDEQNPT